MGNFSVRFNFIYKQVLQFDVTYSQPLGSDSLSKDRDYVSLTLKYTY